MATTIQLDDVENWVYRGEGAANIVLSYVGSSSAFIGKILRVQKVQKDTAQIPKACVVLSKLEQVLWHDVVELKDVNSGVSLGQLYTSHVMSQYLGSDHVHSGICVSMSRNFLKLINSNIRSQRPSSRVDEADIDIFCHSALLLPDHSIFVGKPRESICVAVEIKPKCGFLPSSEFILKENYIKRQTTRYKMHQHFKFHHGEIQTISEYNPLDLFSQSKERIYKAIKALVSNPQNNLRIFLNGSLVVGGLGGAADNLQSLSSHKIFEDLMNTSGLQSWHIIELVTEVIFQSRIFDRLLDAQKLDALDIEGAIHAYYDIISEPCLVCQSIVDAESLHHRSLLHSSPLEKSMKIVRDYLISATAKDCSLMMSIRLGDGLSISEKSTRCIESLNEVFDYKAFFVDLDMKPLKKMVRYYEQDQKIVNFYKKNFSK